MRKVWSTIVFWTVVALTLVAMAGPSLADKRVALVVGNANYKHNPPLGNPANDARDVARALTEIGFDVTLELDVEKRKMDQVVAQFARAAKTSDAALFYYAGHGMQYQGKNFLMPIDAEMQDEVSIRYELTAMDDVKAALQLSRGVKIMVLDSCRDNPLAEKLMRSISVSTRDIQKVQGYARQEKTQGILIVYATQADEVANDGVGRNSPFSAAFLKEIREPGLEVGTMFRRIGSDVYEATQGRQVPEMSVSAVPEYYLNQAETDQAIWARIRVNADASTVREFIDRYPNSFYALDAKTRLEQLLDQEARKQAQGADAERQRQAKEAEAARLKAEQEARERAAAEAHAHELELSGKLAAAEAERQKMALELARREADQAAAEKQRQAKEAEAARLEDEQGARERAVADARQHELELSGKLAAAEAERQKLAQELARREADQAAADARNRAEADKLARDAQRGDAADQDRVKQAAADKAALERDRVAQEEAAKALKAETDRAEALKTQIAQLEQQAAQAKAAARAETQKAEDAKAAAAANAKGERDRVAQEDAAKALKAETERADALKTQIADLERQAAQAKAAALAETQKAEEAKAAAAANAKLALLTPAVPTGVDSLAIQIESELRRVGCFSGADGDWGSAGVKLSVANYARFAKLAATPTTPDAALLDGLKGQHDRICPLECSARETALNGRCVAKTCGPGEILGRDGACLAKPAAPRVAAAREIKRTQPAAAPAAKGKCFSFNGNQYCE